ncbi:hypothetical protein BH09ACT13_BH09ACT13_04400 [soil metagenome]
MLPHDRGLGGLERPRLREDRVGDADLADVVEERSRAEDPELLGGKAELASDGERNPADALRVARGVGVACLDRGVQGLDGLEQAFLQSP